MCLQLNKNRVNLGRKSEELHFFFFEKKIMPDKTELILYLKE